MVRIADLYALQEIDTLLDSVEESLARVRERLAQDVGLEESRARLAVLDDEVRAANAALHDAEVEAGDGKAKVTEVEAKLYGGTVTASRELRDLQKEVDSLQRQQQARDDAALAALAVAETARAEQATVRGTVEARHSAWEGEQEQLAADVVRLEAEIAALQARRALAARPIDQATMGLYERLRKMRAGRGVARVQRGACQGCHIMLPTTIFQKARNGMTVVQCSSCERILYVG